MLCLAGDAYAMVIHWLIAPLAGGLVVLMKKKMRQHVRETLLRIPPHLSRDKSRAASAALTALPEFELARTVFLYLPMTEEVDTRLIAEAAWRDNKVVLVPRCHMSDRSMEACPIYSFNDHMIPSYYGIHEPCSEAYPAERIDFVVVPGMAFDRSGGRLGRGAGFYDRFLVRLNDQATTCGLAFDEQVIESVPMFDHDERLDILVTDKETLRFS